uniref:Uncharacterized protein n=1 Tax=Onchocerca volvulus TaxID=6282 RepID=A0A2K6VN76_ONCVO
MQHEKHAAQKEHQISIREEQHHRWMDGWMDVMRKRTKDDWQARGRGLGSAMESVRPPRPLRHLKDE